MIAAGRGVLRARDRCCVGFWLGLCPDNRVSGGKVLKAKTRKVVSRVAAAALRLAAQPCATASTSSARIVAG